MASLPGPTVRVVVAVAALAGAVASGHVGSRDEPAARSRPVVLVATPTPAPTVAPPSRFATRLPGVVAKLNHARGAARHRLAHRTGRHVQARSATQLQRAFERAAARLGPPPGPAAARLVAALRATARSYRELARAADRGRTGWHARAAHAVDRRERELAALLRRRYA